jgi:Signal transduction histidine kinase
VFRDFRSAPTICDQERLLTAFSLEEGQSIRISGVSFTGTHPSESDSYEQMPYMTTEHTVEAWTPEATNAPLAADHALASNRNDEISPSLLPNLDYVLTRLLDDVAQMLYYARLKSSTHDDRFEDVIFNDCLGELLEDYAPLLEEKPFVILNKLQSETVYTDRRGLQFMLGQIVSDAITYSSDSPMLTISVIHSETADILSVEDNGIGVQ